MALKLSKHDQSLLDGQAGPAARMAMSILVRMAEVYGATELIDITQAHIDSTIYIGEAGLEFAERLAGLGAQVAVPSTLNVSGVDEHGWEAWAVPPEWAHKARRQMLAYQHMGCIPTWTCAPYQTQFKPAFGQQIAWGESNAIAFANSVLGARTERYPDLLDICCAITGRAPAVGLHLTANRAGQVLVRLRDIPRSVQQDDTFYPVLGHWIGKIASDRIPVVEGLTVPPTEDQLKALGAAAASSGAVALFHIVGVTPEAPTREAAFQGRPPEEITEVTMSALRKARRELTCDERGWACDERGYACDERGYAADERGRACDERGYACDERGCATDERGYAAGERNQATTDGPALDMVVLGCPHFSLAEFQQLAPLLEGRRAHPGVKFLVTSSRAMTQLAERAGALARLKAFGGQVTVDTCVLASPMLPPEIETLMTNSAKCAYYAPGMLNTRVAFGSLVDCVRSAVAGRVLRETSLWES
jgi:hypothetical protein